MGRAQQLANDKAAVKAPSEKGQRPKVRLAALQVIAKTVAWLGHASQGTPYKTFGREADVTHQALLGPTLLSAPMEIIGDQIHGTQLVKAPCAPDTPQEEAAPNGQAFALKRGTKRTTDLTPTITTAGLPALRPDAR